MHFRRSVWNKVGLHVDVKISHLVMATFQISLLIERNEEVGSETIRVNVIKTDHHYVNYETIYYYKKSFVAS